MAELLDDDEIAAGLPDGWTHEGEEVVRTFEFDDYLTGVAFAQAVGEIAETEWHHPTIEIRYGEVEVRFTSHEAGGITDQDLELAALVDGEYDG